MSARPTPPELSLSEPETKKTGLEELHPAPEAAVVSLEGVALQHGFLPVTLLRETCSPDAEKIVRKLGRVPHSAEPWLPVTTMGPLLVMAHHHYSAADYWGVPRCLCVRVLITHDQYRRTRDDLIQRFTALPISQQNPLETLEAPVFGEAEGLAAVFTWLLQNYPFELADQNRLVASLETAQEKKEVLNESDFNAISRNLGVALAYIRGGGLRFAYNAAEASRQEIFPMGLLERHNVYPLFSGRQTVYLLSDSPDNYAFEDEWLSLGSKPYRMIPVLADSTSIRETLARASANFDPNAVGKIETNVADTDDANIVEIVAEDMARVNPQNPSHSPEELIHWALYTAIRCRASDLHIEKFYASTRFRARIDGTMKTILTAPEELLVRFVALVKNWANMSQTRQECQDGRYALRIGRRRLDVRVAAVPTRREFQKVIMRFLDKQDGVRKLTDFNLSQRQLDVLNRAMQRDQGLVLVTGPTGSGKTTTLYAMLNSVNDETVNIQTIEDPIEYEIEGINQTQTNAAYNLDFANGLRSLLRADPDIILIGESRDAETANAAINSALTGHLVLTTLHANDSIRAVSRLLSMGVEKYLVADSLALSQAQRLVRRLCNYCKRPIAASHEVQSIMARQGIITQELSQPIYENVGCGECHNTGYSGRLALMEVCETTDEIRDLIEAGASQSVMRTAALKSGFRTLYQEGLVQVVAGFTTMEEIRCLAYTAV